MKFINILFILLVAFGFNTYAQSTLKYDNVEIIKERNILIPTAFTPNGDGYNDEFKMVNVSNETLIEFRVFNRWGTTLFTTRDIHKGWDGRYKGQDQEMGVYGYFIRIKYSDGVEEVYKGTVTLLR